MSDTLKPTVRTVRSTEERLLQSDVFELRSRTQPPRNGTGFIREAAREIPVYHHCDVLVVGGGPSGTAAAAALPRSRAPTSCCSSATTTWAASRPAAS